MRTFEEISADADRAMISNDVDLMHTLADELQTVPVPQAKALAALVLGTAARQVGEYARALENFRRAHDLYEEHGDTAGMARATGSIGNAHHNMGNNASAIEHYRRAMALHTELGDRIGVARSANNMGNVYYNTGDYPSALEHYRSSLAIYAELGDVVASARITANIGNIFGITGDYPSALEHFQQAMASLEERSDRFTMALVTVNIGGVYKAIGNSTLALEHFERALSLTEELGDRANTALCYANMGNVHSEIGEYEKALDHYLHALSSAKEMGDSALVANMMGTCSGVYIEMGRYDDASACLDALATMTLASPLTQFGYKANCSELSRHRGDLDAANAYALEALEIASAAGLRAEAARCHKLLLDLAQLRNDFAAYIEHNNEFTRITQEINGKDTATKLAMQAKQREIDAREREHQRHLAVLHSTLPKEVADRVARGEVVNDHYDDATVIFADIVGFTQISESLSAGEVVALLERIFTAFDAICEQHNVTKIKTIGDSYMAVSFDNVMNAARCALEFNRIQYTLQNAEFDPTMIQFRIGMHCGPVTAGVIGTQRLQYDVWGDTVNVASRMESSGEPGRVHVTEALADQLKENRANTEYIIQNAIMESTNLESHEVPLVTRNSSLVPPHVTCNSSLVTIERGSIDIKGKGPMNTYWLVEG